MQSPIVVDFPLRGEWIAPNTPGTKIPSHGTDLFGERYAFDFVGIDRQAAGRRFYRPSPLRYLVSGVRLEECFGWGRPIYSATDGVVVRAEDGIPERNPVNLFRDVRLQAKNARDFTSNRGTDFRVLSGNYVIVEFSGGYAVYAHAQTGSVRVRPGERVAAGQHLANVGHSGNSTAPHLHFHLMDREDPWTAQGLPCCFREYEVFRDGAWQPVQNGIPKADEIIRKV